MQGAVPLIAPPVLSQALTQDANIKLLDVRSKGEFADGHAVGALNPPLDRLSKQSVRAIAGRDAGTEHPLYLLCASGARAEQAARNLMNQGLDNVVLVDGGTNAWRASRLPMTRSSAVWSLERQTQIALGLLVMFILAKGSLLDPLFFGLFGFLGLGLIFAGLTARCTLTAMLARMPWNRASAG